MFAPPPEIKSEVFAKLPQEFRKLRSNAWTDANRGHPMECFLEGPSFDREGNLYCVDIPFGRIFRISPDGKFTLVAEYDGEPNGLKIHKDGSLIVADYKNGIMQIDPKSGEVRPIVQRRWAERLKGPNDLFLGKDGSIYFTDQGQTGLHDPTGRVYRYRPSGQLDLLINTAPSPNGLVMNLDESALFVAMTRGCAIWRLPIKPDGSCSKVGICIQMSGLSGPDGMALDEKGNIVVAHPGIGCVWLFDPWGVPLLRVNTAAGRSTTNIAYGGPERRHLYITESQSGSILRAEMPHPGKPMFSHQ